MLVCGGLTEWVDEDGFFSRGWVRADEGVDARYAFSLDVAAFVSGVGDDGDVGVFGF